MTDRHATDKAGFTAAEQPDRMIAGTGERLRIARRRPPG